MRQFIFLLIFAFSSQALALYDFAAINIIPQGEQISFCFEFLVKVGNGIEKIGNRTGGIFKNASIYPLLSRGNALNKGEPTP